MSLYFVFSFMSYTCISLVYQTDHFTVPALSLICEKDNLKFFLAATKKRHIHILSYWFGKIFVRTIFLLENLFFIFPSKKSNASDSSPLNELKLEFTIWIYNIKFIVTNFISIRILWQKLSRKYSLVVLYLFHW